MTSTDSRLTWVGHSTGLIDVDGYRVITDPLLTRRVAHLRRRCDLPEPASVDVDLVLISHGHMDHLHLPSLRMLRPDARVVTPVGTGRLVEKAGFSDVVEVVPRDSVRSGPATIDVVPAVHKSGRGPHSRVEATPVGYVVGIDGVRVYFAGDTDLFAGMADLTAIDVALIPIWGWGSTIGEGHLDPARAVEATGLIDPAAVVPIHWGTYAPEDARRRQPRWLDEPIGRFVDAIERSELADRLRLLRPGESIDLADRRNSR